MREKWHPSHDNGDDVGVVSFDEREFPVKQVDRLVALLSLVFDTKVKEESL